MDSLQMSAVAGLLVLTVCFSLQLQSSAISEDTLVSSFVLLSTVGLAIKASTRFQASPKTRPSNNGQIIPSYRSSGGSSASAARLDSLRRLGVIDLEPAHETIFIVLTVTLLLRIQLARTVIRHIGCARASLAPLLPIAVAFALFLVQRRRSNVQKPTKSRRRRSSLSEAAPVSRITGAQILLLVTPCAAALCTIRAFASPQSTYICATSSPLIWQVPLLQLIGTVLDAVLLFYLARIVHNVIDSPLPDAATVHRLVGSVFTVTASLLLFWHGIYYFIMHPFFPRMPLLSIPYLWSLGKMTPFVAAFAIFSMRTILILDVVFTSTAIIVLVAATSTATHIVVSSALTSTHAAGLAAVFLMLVSFGAILRMKLQTLQAAPRPRSWNGLSLAYFVTSIAFAVFIFSRVHRSMLLSEHPIDLLMRNADNHHYFLMEDAKTSKNLHELIESYSSRYGRLPPPHFNKWYEYATARKSIFIDSFDQIYTDLLPFYGLDPQVIRERTSELIANPWNGISSISIRSGKAHLGPRIGAVDLPMMESLQTMINKFAIHLPDMDLAFNLYEEPRVAVPFERMHYLEEMAHLHEVVHKSQTQFQPGRSMHWPHLPEQGQDNSVMREVAYHAVWEQFATVGCPPSSPARRLHYWDRAAACVECEEMHSPQGLVSNWTLAADMCHQPDLANLHGFFMAHDAYKGTNKLYPVFSTAKMAGFNDILYPSWLSYQDAASTIDTPWADKMSDLFWRGSTTEGISYGGRQWQGMLRQRFVHLINNIKNSAPAAALLVPRTSEGLAYEYHDFTAADLQSQLRADVQITPDIERCRDSDCDLQRWEFAPNATTASMAEHLQHKYLLDLDGKGRSSRFLTFLRSSSVPVKAGLFREWWSDRVIPWLHFVPLDVRGRGLWNTLAYFMGLDAQIRGKTIQVAPRDEDAKKIGAAGKAWAAQALRQEDMEIYMFRLLLEWARMTDDWRDEIGFSGNRDIVS